MARGVVVLAVIVSSLICVMVAAATRRELNAWITCRRLEAWYPSILRECRGLSDAMLTHAHRRPSEWGSASSASALLKLHAERTGWIYAWKSETEPNRDWLNFGLIFDGRPVGKNCDLCPVTMGLLSSVKGLQKIAGFSLLRPGGTIARHTDNLHPDSRTFHLGLIVPDGAALTVEESGDERASRRPHRAGRAFWFDSRRPHWAENPSRDARVVLYLDIRL